jgi:hypothetical protein
MAFHCPYAINANIKQKIGIFSAKADASTSTDSLLRKALRNDQSTDLVRTDAMPNPKRRDKKITTHRHNGTDSMRILEAHAGKKCS